MNWNERYVTGKSYGDIKYDPSQGLSHINRQNGQFLKGHVPFNKGKKWSEWMGKRKQRKCMKGWKNLDLYRHKKRADVADRCRKAVIAILDDGRWKMYPYIGAAALELGGCRENVRRCCQCNERGKNPTKTWKRINTDHKYMGVRFYFENDETWLTKIQ